MKTLVMAAALLFTASAGAASPIYWTPAKMSRALVALQYPHPGTLSGRCVGLSKATKVHKGAYTAFRCLMVWQTTGPEFSSGKVRVWAKPLAKGRICGSTVGLRQCRPLAAGPLAGDPTVCAVHDPAACAQAASKAAIVQKHGIQVNLACTAAGSIYRWSCASGAGPYTVTWTKGLSAWNAEVTP